MDLELVIGTKNYSSWSLRPWLFLRHAGVPFTEVRIPLDTPEWSQRIGQYSPTRRVPVLRDDGVTVWDSLAILEHLAERFPEAGGWPAEPRVRSMARCVSAEMHSGFAALREELPMNCRQSFKRRRFSEHGERDIARVLEIWNSCPVSEQQAGPFLFGAFSIADAMFSPVALRFVTYDVPLDSTSQTYVDAIRSLPPVRDWILDAEREPEVIERYEVIGRG